MSVAPWGSRTIPIRIVPIQRGRFRVPAWSLVMTKLRAAKPALEEPSLLLSVKEAAHLMGLGMTSVYNLVAAGELASVRILDRHLIKRAAVEAYIASRPSPKIKSPRKPRHRRLG